MIMEEQNQNKNQNDFENRAFETLNKSQDDFEKQISFIGAGSLGLSFLFIEKIVKLDTSCSKWLLISGWCFLASTLFLNLISHHLSARYNFKAIEKSQNNCDHFSYQKKTNKIINCVNFVTLILLILGISFILIFSSINI